MSSKFGYENARYESGRGVCLLMIDDPLPGLVKFCLTTGSVFAAFPPLPSGSMIL